MHKLLLIARRQVIQRPQQRLSMRHYKRIARCYKAILEQGRSEMPQIPPRKKGQRGPLARSDAHNLHQRLVVQRKNVLRFTRRADTPFTNNRSERAGRRRERVCPDDCVRRRDHPRRLHRGRAGADFASESVVTFHRND